MTDRYAMFPVPVDQVPAVARFLYGNRLAPVEASEVSEAHEEEEDREPTPEEREKYLDRIYRESEPPFRRLLVQLAERESPDTPVSYGGVRQAMGWPNRRSLPGALGAFGRRTNHRYDGFWPFHRGWDPFNWTHTLAMDPEVAEEVLRLHAALGLPIQ